MLLFFGILALIALALLGRWAKKSGVQPEVGPETETERERREAWIQKMESLADELAKELDRVQKKLSTDEEDYWGRVREDIKQGRDPSDLWPEKVKLIRDVLSTRREDFDAIFSHQVDEPVIYDLWAIELATIGVQMQLRDDFLGLGTDVNIRKLKNSLIIFFLSQYNVDKDFMEVVNVHVKT